MKKIFLLFLASAIFSLSCNKTKPALTDSEALASPVESEVNPIVEILFYGSSEKLSFDDIIKNISDGGMTAKLIDDSRTDAKISMEDDVYYPVNPNIRSDIKISPLDTFIEILNSCEYIETDSLNEHRIYAFIFYAADIDGKKNEICVYVTRSCVKFTYNGISDGKEYVNISNNNNDFIKYYNVCEGYDFYINGIIPDENGQLATIW